jgi:hypothetical protein
MKYLIPLLITLSFLSIALPANEKREINLKGKWKLKSGDDPSFAASSFNDSGWKTARVPARWEDEGLTDHDGYGWYRISFYVSDRLAGKVLYLALGKIDDVDQTYLNGKLINNSGSFPPNYVTAYNTDRFYFIPKDYLNFNGDNVIAVRVYDQGGDGGIVSGNVGIYSVNQVPLILDLSGQWKFRLGDSETWNRMDLNERQWQSIIVPGTWESQGYDQQDGFAWYRKQVLITTEHAKEKLILSLGRIDDVDEVFFNGEKIGGVGPINDLDKLNEQNSFWSQERYYYILPKLIHADQDNIIAVRVYDIGQNGGIYDGAIGITTQRAYLKFKDTKSRSFWDLFFND